MNGLIVSTVKMIQSAADEIAQLVKALATRPKPDINPRTHMVAGENELPQVIA